MVIRHYLKKLYRHAIVFYFKKLVGNKEFCIISNDCWGGEIYKMLGRPFNSPFIGLMVMAPCYIKLLENLQFLLKQPLTFIENSQYSIVQELIQKQKCPIGVLGNSDIEICFLHYTSQEIALEKWSKRVKRIDWNNLYFKFDCGKDYADKLLVEKFLQLPFKNKLVFGKENFGFEEVIVTKTYSPNSLLQLRNCFLYVILLGGWFIVLDSKIILTD